MRSKKNKMSTSPKFNGYIPVYLDEKAKKAIKANMPTIEELWNRLNRFAEDDYRVTLGWDNYNECYSVSLFDCDARRATAGYVLSAKHSDLLVAASSLVYLHEKVFPDGWDIERVGKQDDVNW